MPGRRRAQAGQRVTVGRDGRPRALHPLVREHEGERHITARSEAELAAIQRRLRERAERDGNTYHEGPAEISQERPAIEGRVCVSPGAWERMAAKVVLGVASEALPEMWRQSSAAAALRERLHDLERRADAVRLRPTPDFVGMLAPEPCSFVSSSTRSGSPRFSTPAEPSEVKHQTRADEREGLELRVHPTTKSRRTQGIFSEGAIQKEPLCTDFPEFSEGDLYGAPLDVSACPPSARAVAPRASPCAIRAAAEAVCNCECRARSPTSPTTAARRRGLPPRRQRRALRWPR